MYKRSNLSTKSRLMGAFYQKKQSINEGWRINNLILYQDRPIDLSKIIGLKYQ